MGDLTDPEQAPITPSSTDGELAEPNRVFVVDNSDGVGPSPATDTPSLATPNSLNAHLPRSVGSQAPAAAPDLRQTLRPDLRRLAALLGPALGLITIALVFDLWGIYWGLPNITHVRSYHPDEWRVIEAAQLMDPFAGRLTPGFYNYGSLYMDALWVVFTAGNLVGWLDVHTGGTWDPANTARIYLAARMLSVLFGVGAVLGTWRLGRLLFGRNTGLLAGVLLAACPLFAIDSHYAAVDVPAAFFMILATWAAAADRERGRGSGGIRPRVSLPLILGAAAAGLAAGTKYNAGVIIIPCLLAWYWRMRDHVSGPSPISSSAITPQRGQFFGDLLFGWMCLAFTALAAFLISTPGVMLDRAQFVRDLGYEMWHSSSGHEYLFSHTLPAFLYHLVESLPIGMGPPLLAVTGAGLLFALGKRTRGDALIAAAVLPYYLVIGTSQLKFMRYVIPLLPFLCVWAARLLIAAYQGWGPPSGAAPTTDDSGPPPTLASRSPDAIRLRKGLAAVCIALAGGFAAAETAAYDKMLAGPDVRDQALSWIVDNIPEHASIGMPISPWFDSPPIIPFNTAMPPAEVESREGQWPYYIEVTGRSAAELVKRRPAYYLLTEWQIRYRERIHHLDPNGKSDAAKAGRETADFLSALHRRYREAAVFRAQPHLGSIKFWPGHFVPEDWLYPNPTIWVYERVR